MILAAIAFALASNTFVANTTLPKSTVYAPCGGANRSPELHWRGAPRGTRSFALVTFDPDTTGGWYHWVAYNIPSATHELPEAAQLPAAERGLTSFKERSYGGACPPPGKVHHYIFTLYALSVSSAGAPGLTGPQLLAKIRRDVLGTATITGFYQR
ncbi:MAG TPA: YbhB/YbcL family Raf kinase inhibitor-like protein [Candidatus Rubrimentiphilum sp.]|nr:YbhB/YbcL family Raf kinase inhibitor-like protein [Candidatus Rubrimentiphilum sp.]